MTIAQKTAELYEIWLWSRPDHKIHVDECGRFRSELLAEQCATLVRDWLKRGYWSPELTDFLSDEEDEAGLTALPEVLRALGIDPRLTVVEATRASDPRTKFCGACRADGGHAAARGPRAAKFRARF